jgi:hypothetical protein
VLREAASASLLGKVTQEMSLCGRREGRDEPIYRRGYIQVIVYLRYIQFYFGATT